MKWGKSGDNFKGLPITISGTALYCALIGYIWYEAPEDEKNFTTLLEMINASEAREDDPEFQNPVDLMFERLEEKDPEHFAVRQYKNSCYLRARPQKLYPYFMRRGLPLRHWGAAGAYGNRRNGA